MPLLYDWLALVQFFGALARDLDQLVAFVTQVGNFGRMADQNDAFSLIGQLAEDVHNLALGVAIQVAFALSAAYRIDKPRQDETAITRAMMPIRIFLPADRLIHRSAFLIMYMLRFLRFVWDAMRGV